MMDLRSIQPGLAAVSQMPLFMVHPKTGEMITPLGYGKRGPVWPVMGGAPDDDDAGGDDDNDADEDADEDDESDDEDSDDDGDEGEDGKKGKKKGNAQAKIKALEEEKDRHFRKANKFRTRAEAAEAEVAALKAKYESGNDKDDKDGDKDTKPKVDDAKLKAAEKQAQELKIENAFLSVNEIDWINKGQVMTLLQADDDYEIEFDENGKVDRKSLKAELKRFAKANPHLVKKPAAKTDDGDDDADEGGTGSKSTAPKMNGQRKGKKNQPKTREELAKKFPALNRMG